MITDGKRRKEKRKKVNAKTSIDGAEERGKPLRYENSFSLMAA